MVHRHKGILHPVISETFDVELTLLRAEECVSALFSLACSFFLLASPKVQVYTQTPGWGKSNVLLCHVSDFHPPEIMGIFLCVDQRRLVPT